MEGGQEVGGAEMTQDRPRGGYLLKLYEYYNSEVPIHLPLLELFHSKKCKQKKKLHWETSNA